MLATNKHATARAIQSVRACNIALVAAEHRLSIGIVADEPSESRQSLCRCLHIDHSFNNPTHIISSLDGPMKLEGIMPDVASDGSRVRMSSVFGQIVETDSVPL